MKVKAFVFGITVSLFAAVGLSMAPAASAARVPLPLARRIVENPWVSNLAKGPGGKIFGDAVDKAMHARPTVNECGWFGLVDGYLPLPDWMFLVDQGCHVETAGVTQSEEQQLSVKYQKQDAAAVAKYRYHAPSAG